MTVGDTVGLSLSGKHLSVFDGGTGRAINTALYAEAGHG